MISNSIRLTAVAFATSFLVLRDLFSTSGVPTIKQIEANITSMQSASVELQANDTVVVASQPQRSLFCEPKKREENSRPTGRAPLVVWAQARSGSTLLLDMFSGINAHTTEEDLDLFTYGEFYNGNIKQLQLDFLQKDMEKSCKPPDNESHKKRRKRKSSSDWWQKQAEDLYDVRQANPTKLFYSLSDMPSWSKKPFYIIKMFTSHLRTMTEHDLVKSLDKLQGVRKPKYLVLWRRRMIESHVSEQVARVTGEWQQRSDQSRHSKPTMVSLNRTKIELYTQKYHRYYSEVRDALRSSNADHMVLEYDADFADSSVHSRTVQKLVDFFELGSSNINVQKIVDGLHMKKQAQVPISEQVENWEDVLQWGFGGEVEDWADIFEE